MIVLRFGAVGSIQRERHFNMTAHELLLENLAQSHLKRVSPSGHTHMQVEKTMIHAFQAERVAETVADAPRDSGEPSHGMNRCGSRCQRQKRRIQFWQQRLESFLLES